MTSMRLRKRLQGFKFGYTVYSFGGTDWTLILIDNSITLNSYTEYTYKETISSPGSGANNEAVLITDKFLFPHIIKPVAIVDGTLFGQLKYGMYINQCYADKNIKLTKIEVTLKKIDSDGNETDLASTHTVNANWNETECVEEHIASFLFFFHITDKKIQSDERLLLEVKPYGESVLGAGGGHYYRYALKNSDDQSIDIPIV